MIRGRTMGEIVGGEKWNSKTLWGQSEGVQNPGHDFMLSRSFHACGQRGSPWDEVIAHLLKGGRKMSFYYFLFSFYRALPSPPLCHRIWSWWRIVSVSNQLNSRPFQVLEHEMVWGSDYFPGIKSPHRAQRSIGAHLFFMVIKFSGNISILNAFKLDDQHSYFLY